MFVRPALVGGLPADADGAANVRPGRSRGLRGCDGLVQPVPGLVVFARCGLQACHSVQRCEVGFPSLVDGDFYLA